MTDQSHKIMFVVGQLGGGGLERQLVTFLSLMDRVRLRPCIVVWNYNRGDVWVNAIEQLGVQIHGLERSDGSLARLMKLRRLARELRPQIIHSYSNHTNFPAWIAARAAGAIAIGSIRNDLAASRRTLGVTKALLSSTFPRVIIANSQSARDAALGHPLMAGVRVEFVPNGIDVSKFTTTPAPAPPPLEIIGIGSLTPVKRWSDALEALALLKADSVAFHCRILGDGKMREELVALVARLRLESSVSFPGFCSDVQAALASAHVLVHVAEYEGTPNAVLEAMAAARPVIATPVGDVPRIVSDGENGFITPTGNPRYLADKLKTLVGMPQLMNEMGARARRFIEKHYSLDALVANTFDVYRRAGWSDND